MFKIRLTGQPDEIEKVQSYLKMFVPGCTYISNPYPQTRKSKFNTSVAVYMEFKDWED